METQIGIEALIPKLKSGIEALTKKARVERRRPDSVRLAIKALRKPIAAARRAGATGTEIAVELRASFAAAGYEIAIGTIRQYVAGVVGKRRRPFRPKVVSEPGDRK